MVAFVSFLFQSLIIVSESRQCTIWHWCQPAAVRSAGVRITWSFMASQWLNLRYFLVGTSKLPVPCSVQSTGGGLAACLLDTHTCFAWNNPVRHAHNAVDQAVASSLRLCDHGSLSKTLRCPASTASAATLAAPPAPEADVQHEHEPKPAPAEAPLPAAWPEAPRT